MNLKQIALSPLWILLVVLQLAACGNKGDLFLVPDETAREDLRRLEQSFETQVEPAEALGEDDEDDTDADSDKSRDDSTS